MGLFRDGQKFIEKPIHPFTTGETRDEINKYRIMYDEFVAYTDFAFGQLVKEMEARGLLENTYLIVTSDHGEIFERGLYEHLQPVLYIRETS